MRKILNSMILGLSAVLALVGCGGTTYPDAITAWRDEDIQLMDDVLGQAIPVAPMTSNYEREILDHEILGTVLYLYDETIGDRGEAYGEILLKAGYIFDRMDEDTHYDRYYYDYVIPHDGVFDYITVEYFYYPGNPTTTARFIVYAWFEDGGEMFTEWPTSEIADAISTTETAPTFEASSYVFKYFPQRGCYGIYGYTTDATVEETYTSTLEGAGWTIDDSQYADGYGIYADSPEGELRLQYAYQDNTEDEESGVFILYIYVIDAEEETPAE